MPQVHEWSKLRYLQVGRYAEYFVKMQFVRNHPPKTAGFVDRGD